MPWSRASLSMFFLWLLLALTIDVRAGTDAWVERTVSDLVHEQPVLVPVSLVANAASVFCLGMAFRRGLRPHSRAGAFLVAAGALTVVAALVPTDNGRIESLHGWIHAVAATGTFLALNLAFWSAVAVLDRTPVWKTHRPRAVAVASVATAALVHLGVVLAVRQVTGTAWTDALGLWERLLILANMAWIGLAAWHGSRPRL